MTDTKRSARLVFRTASPLLLAAALGASFCHAEDSQKPASPPAADVLVLANGDTLHGKFVKELGGKISFHTDALGDVEVAWDKIKELHVSEPFAVLGKDEKQRNKKHAAEIPTGTFDVENNAITVHPQNAAAPVAIPTGKAQYIMDRQTLDTQLFHEPSFFAGWNGAATAGATLVAATQNQYTVSGGVSLVRTVPGAGWLDPRNRTSADFSGSYGKIIQPAYVNAGVTVPQNVVKSAIYHIDGERDLYFSKKLFALGQVAFDHNFAQDLQLQQIYGGGLGWTLFSTPRHTADLKATLQYEKQKFISGASTSQNLVGSTFAANYSLHSRLFTYAQGLAYIPAYNTPRAYSANETNIVTFPAYKNLGFSLGTIDTYLNDPPASLPPTKRNSFQFTMGLTYAIKSKY